MLVYGDAERLCDAEAARATLAATLKQAREVPPGLSRHGVLVNAFVQAGELVQAVLDAEWERRGGFDAPSANGANGAALLHGLAGAIGISWESGFRDLALPFDAGARLAALQPVSPVRLRKAEGFALYALYPECFWEAARRSGLGADTRVIGIRSIGLPLAAIVAAALGAGPPVSFRPSGHPFARRIDAAPEAVAELVSAPAAGFAVVDEGPGLSGSSFAAVAELLEAQGVARSRICFFPSHDGFPGPQASEPTRKRWGASRRFTRSFDQTVLGGGGPRGLDRWVAGLLGPLEEPLEDIGGGGWRRHVESGAAIPADGRLERRKFLARSGGGTFLVKFAGLGETGRRKLRNAEMLHEAGFSPRPAGLAHGMLATHWREGRPLLSLPPRREALLRVLGQYLGFRAKHLKAHNGGANPGRLAQMARFNTQQSLGESAVQRLEPLLAQAGTWNGEFHPVDTDNRLHRWEWLETAPGAWLKLDALDHSSGHDLVGCQDIAWDVAGAVAEFDLDRSEAETLRETAAEGAGRRIAREVVGFLLPCYLAFQAGLWTMAADAAGGEERPKLRMERNRYQARLAAVLSTAGPA